MNLIKNFAFYLPFLLCGFLSYGQHGEFIKIGKDSINIYIEDVGNGKPIVFIPGWTMTSQFFKKQKDFFKNNNRFISYDPRSHGRSTKTESGNTYKNHAQELYSIFEKLKIDDIILVGWSSGCATIYEYIQLFGTANLSHLVFIDEPPKWIGNDSKEWVYGTFENYRGSLKELISKRKAYADDVIEWMLAQPIEESEKRWMLDEVLMTPNGVALSLYIDGLISDYNETAKSLNGQIPMLYMVRESWFTKANNWLGQNVSEAIVVPISSHAVFWEEPKKFNSILESFIQSD